MASTADLVERDASEEDIIPNRDNGETTTTATAEPEPPPTGWSSKKTIKEKINYLREVVTVEPLIVTYIAVGSLAGPAILALQITKSCKVSLNYTDEICDAILNGNASEHFKMELEKVQLELTRMQSWLNPLQSIIPLIIILFLGSFSDRHKIRKPFFVIPLIGELFSVFGLILCVVYMDTWSLEVTGIMQLIVPSIFGAPQMIVVSLFAYVADISSMEMLTLRMGIVQTIILFVSPVITSFSGILYEKVGFYWILIIVFVMLLYAIYYGIIVLKEPKQPDVNFKDTKSFLMDIFNPLHVIETFTILGKKVSGKSRLWISLLLLFQIVYAIINYGEGSLIFLYMQKQFGITVTENTYFSTFSMVVRLIGNFLGLTLFTKIFPLKDTVIIFIVLLELLISRFVCIIGKSMVAFYIVSVIELVGGLLIIAIRSLITKSVSETDIAKIQSLLSICDAISTTIGVPFYNTIIYPSTVQTFPQAFFYVSTLFILVCIVINSFIYITEKRRSKRAEQKQIKNGNVQEKPVPLEDMVTHI